MNINKTAWWLLLIGGLNWLLVGLFQQDIFGFVGISMYSGLARLVYLLIGVAALYKLSGKNMKM